MLGFQAFFEENLAKYPAMSLADLKQRWDILTRGDIYQNPLGWADRHPKVKEALRLHSDSTAKMALAIREALREDGEEVPTIRQLVVWVREIRGW